MTSFCDVTTAITSPFGVIHTELQVVRACLGSYAPHTVCELQSILFSGRFFVGFVTVVEDQRSELACNLAREPQFIAQSSGF